MSRPPRSKRIDEDARENQPSKASFAEQSNHPNDGGPPPYDDWTEKQLMEEAARRGVTGFEHMDRDELLLALAAPDTQRSVNESSRREDEAA